jgi:Zn-dependent peptidase ImmA (M78 family)
MVTIAVNRKVIEWARTEVQLTQSEAAQELGMALEELVAYESGIRKPTLSTLKKMAAKYGVSVAVLAMPEPLPREERPEDFRTIDGGEERISRKTAIAIRLARNYQAQLQDIQREEPDLVIKYSVPDTSQNQSAKALALRERERIGIKVSDQLAWKTDNQALRIWRDAIEVLGVFVFILDFPNADCEGFSLREGTNPVIAISKHGFTDAAKAFTLLHEYGHVLIHRPGLSNLNNGNSVERFCNQFAAHLLMPEEALRAVLELPERPAPQEWSAGEIKAGAGKLHVSQQALALRLEDAGYADIGFYDAFKAAQPRRKKEAAEVRIKPQVKRLSELGATYVGSAITSYDRGNMSDLETYRMLGLSPRYFDDLRDRLKGRLPYRGQHRPIR